MGVNQGWNNYWKDWTHWLKDEKWFKYDKETRIAEAEVKIIGKTIFKNY